MFTHLARRYDGFNRVVSLGFDYLWRPQALEALDRFWRGQPCADCSMWGAAPELHPTRRTRVPYRSRGRCRLQSRDARRSRSPTVEIRSGERIQFGRAGRPDPSVR